MASTDTASVLNRARDSSVLDMIGRTPLVRLHQFERENPGIHVRVQTMPWSAAHEKLLTSFVGEATPDVAQLGNTWVPEFTAIHAIDNLEPYIARSPVVNRDAFFHGIWDTNVVDDTTFGIPWYVDTRVIFYRRDLLAYTMIVEVIFRWPGLGYQLVQSILGRDYPVAQTLALLLTFCVIFFNFLADVGQHWADPRTRMAGGRA